MIQLDLANLRFRALNVSGCYMYGIDSLKVESVLLNGKENHHVFYCDVNQGFAIVNKTNIQGELTFTDNGLIYDLFFGDVEVILNGMEKRTD